MMRAVGACLFLLAALSVIRLYRAYLGTRVKQFEAFCSLIAGLRRHISTRLCSARGYILSLDDATLVGVGFIDAYAELGDLCLSFLRIKDKLSLTEEGLRILEGYFSSFGKGYMDAEIKAADICLEELSEAARKSREDGERALRTVSAFAVAAAAGAAILLI